MSKVLVVSNMYPNKKNPSYGTFVKNFCDQLSQVGISYSKVVMHKHTNYVSKILGYLIFYVFTFMKCLFGAFDRIYVHYPSFSVPPVLWARKLRKYEIITNVHGSDVFPVKKTHEKMVVNTERAIEYSSRVVVPSEYFRVVVHEKYRKAMDEIIVYPSGGVDPELFHPYSTNEVFDIKNKLGIDKSKRIVGFISRICKEKGWECFIEAAYLISNKLDDVFFLVVGSGPDDEILIRKIESLNLKDKIYRFPSQPQKDLAKYYNICDVFVFATTASESLGLVAIEAMACGVPVIASDLAAPKYYIQNGVNGYKTTAGDSDEMASMITQYLNSSVKKKNEMRLSALEFAQTYQPERIQEILRSIIDLYLR